MRPDDFDAKPMREWVVFRMNFANMTWTEVGCTKAQDAGTAFRLLVLPRDGRMIDPANVGSEFRILQMTDGAHLAIGLELKDLNAIGAA